MIDKLGRFGRTIFFVSALLLSISVSSTAQSSCACSVGNGGCSASQTCPAGKIAVCTCSATGCSSECVKDDVPIVSPPDNIVLANKLSKRDVNEIGESLSTIFGKNVVFSPYSESFEFRLNPEKLKTQSHWEIFEYLSENGKLTINDHDLDYWRKVRENLNNGGEISICAGNASVRLILSEISFTTGRKFVISSGDPKTTVRSAIRGSNVDELLQNLSKIGGVVIDEIR